MRCIRASLFCLLLTMATAVESAELHAILLIDSEAENIETAMVKNHHRWQGQFTKISKFTGMKVHEHAFVGKNLLCRDVFQFLESLELDSDDVVLLYFCGHGYRTRHKENPWPYMCWSHENVAVDLLLLTEILEKKNPRLLIALAECCNNFIERQEFGLETETQRPSRRHILMANYCKLFLETQGVIVASSSHPGEYSWAWVDRGSCFTLAFLDCIEKEVRQLDGTEWAIIFELASTKVQDLQSPQYFLNLGDGF